MSKKAGEPITNILPYIAITIIIAIVILILMYAIYQGGLGFVANPPTKKLPV